MFVLQRAGTAVGWNQPAKAVNRESLNGQLANFMVMQTRTKVQ